MTKTINYNHSTNLLLQLSGQDKKIFTIDDAGKILKLNRRYLNNLIQSLVDKKWIRRIEKGKYLIVPLEAGVDREWSEEAFVIASNLVDPYAISYWTALNYWSLTEQVVRTIIVSTTKRKSSREKVILGLPYKFVTLSEKKFFGLTDIWFDGKKVKITDREKTIIDCLDHPEYAGGVQEGGKGLFHGVKNKSIDLATLTDYAKRIGNSTVFKRLGYLAEMYDLSIQEYIDKWQKQIGSGYSLLDPLFPTSGKYYARWNLRLNVSDNDLTNWRYH